MELPSKILEQIAFITRNRIQKHILTVMDKSTHEKHLSQPFKTNNKQFKILMKMVIYRFPYHLVCTKLKV